MNFLPLKPVSNNKMYSSASSKWKSAQYLKFERDAKRMMKFKPITLPKKGGLKFIATFGVSFRFDLDNALKPFIDILQDVYKFNDNRISIIEVKKVSVKRGAEFIEYDLRAI